jgi:hypothetical protein
MDAAAEMGAIVKRALDYPYAVPTRSYLYRDGSAEELPAAGPDLADRTALVAYGANAAPEALGRKLASLPGRELPVLATELAGYDVVYSAHLSPYGAVPATLHPSPGTTVAVHVIHPDPEQLPLLAATEPNYKLTEVAPGLNAFVSRWGELRRAGAPVALAAIRASGRTLRAMSEPEILELVRDRLAPERSLEAFVVAQAAEGGGPLRTLTTAGWGETPQR